MGSSEVSKTFFAVVERIYSFFSASTHRWEVLLKYVPNVVKRVTDTRWSAHYEAVKALQQYFIDVVGASNKLCDQNETRTSAWNLGCNSEFFLCFFFTILVGSPKRIL